jgi:hypothetical protein
MSAILNTLKKLEEEKSVFEQSLDVRDLALHKEFGSTASFFRISQKRNNLIITISSIIFLISSFVLFFYFKSSQSIGNDFAPSNFFETAKSSKVSGVDLPQGASVSGISMDQIPGNRTEDIEGRLISSEAAPVNSAPLENSKVDEVSNQAKVVEVFKLINSGQGMKNSLTQPPISAFDPSEPKTQILKPIKSIQEEIIKSNPELLIQNEIINNKEGIEKTSEEILSLIKNTQISNVNKNASLKPQRYNSLNIPSLKLKGIIFFSDGNPANYIFVSSQGENNVKLKVGESTMGAMLQSIQLNRAIFTKNGETGFVEMGK